MNQFINFQNQRAAIPDICHTHHNRWLWRKNLSCGENFPYDRLSCGEVSPHEKCEENLSHRESSPHDKCGAKCVMWRNVEKSVMWRNFPQDRFLHMRNEKCQANLLCGGISPHDRFLHMSNEKCGESVTWRNFFSSTLRLIRISIFFSCILF